MTVILRDITKRYSQLDSWFYDRFIADAASHSTTSLINDEFTEAFTHGSILDVGSGGGQLALALAERNPSARLIGVDLSTEQVARATRRREAHPKPVADRVQFQVGSAMDLDFPDEHFEAALSVGSIKHWPDRAKGLAEMMRVLRPGGLLLVLEVDRGCSLTDARALMARTNAPRPLREPALWGFRTYIAGQGLDLDEGRALIADHPLTQAKVERVPGDPTLLITGLKQTPKRTE